MKFVSYNVQYGIGLDDRLDLPRIASSIHGADIIALQEVTRNFHRNGNIDMVDELRTLQFRTLLDDSWPHGVAAAVDCALLGRYYERIADHAVIMGSRVIYIVTGLHPEGENWTTA